MQAIITKYVGPTNTRGSRIKAMAEAGSVTVHYDDALTSTANHAEAAMALVRKFKWNRGRDVTLIAGGYIAGYVFVITSNWAEEFTVKATK